MEQKIAEAQQLLAANPPKSGEAIEILKALESTNSKEVYNLLAEVHILLGDLEQAERYAKSAISLDEEYVPAWMSLGAINLKRGEINGALKFYSKANQFDSGNAKIAIAIANIYFLVGNVSGAEALYKTAKKLKPESMAASIGLAKILNTQGKFEQSTRVLNERPEGQVGVEEIQDLLEKNLKGEKFEIVPPIQENEDLVGGLVGESDEPDWYRYLSKLSWINTIFPDGLKNFKGDNGVYFTALNKLSKIEYSKVSDSESESLISEAIELLLQCFEKDEPSTALYFTLARALQMGGNNEEAKIVLKTLLKLPTFAEVQLPFLPPLQFQDNTEVVLDSKNWILVRIIEANLYVQDEENLVDETNRKLAQQLAQNPDALTQFGGLAKPKAARIFPYDFWDGYPTLEKTQKIVAFTKRISNQEFEDTILAQIVQETAERLAEAPTDNVAFFVQVHALLGLKPENENTGKNSYKLDEALRKRDWWRKRGLYNYWFESVEYRRQTKGSEVTAIVIANKFKQKSVENLKRLSDQLSEIGEVLFVNNGLENHEFDQLFPYIDTYVKANGNAGAYLARNLGSLFAKGKKLIFVDDDGIPDEHFIEAHLKEHEERGNIIVSRGVYYSEDVTEDPWHYNIGNKVKPAITILEGNAMYDAAAFYKTGGWGDYILFGYGGTELSYRLLEFYPEKERQIYVPGSRLNHEYFRGDAHKSGKKIKQKVSKMLLDCLHPHLEKEVRDWPSSFEGGESVYIDYSW